MVCGKATIDENNISKDNSVKHEDVDYDNEYYYQYNYDKNGTCYIQKCGNVVTIDSAYTNILSGEIFYEISFYNPQGVFTKLTISREQMDERKILELKKMGVDVSTTTARTLVKVLENQERLQNTQWMYDRLGWHDDKGNLVYLGLNRCIGKTATYRGVWEEVKKAGTRDEWIDMVNKEVVGFSSMELALAVGFSSTAIGFMKREIPTLDYMIIHAVGNSSSGKTTAGELIVSMGSYPKTSGKARSMMLDYGGTEHALIKSLTEISSMPCVIDEASLSRNKNKDLLIYQISMGRERARLNSDATLKTSGYWETIVFSTGEHNLLNYGEQNAGLWVRCIPIEMKSWTESARQSESIKKTVMHNYGHITEEFAEYLLEIKNTGNTEMLIKCYDFWKKELIKKYEEQSKKTSLTERLAGNLAILLFSLETGAECIGIKVDTNAVADLLVAQYSSETISRMDIGENAYNVLMQEITMQPNKILESNNMFIPHSMWGKHYSKKAKTLEDGRTTAGTILILESALEEILRKNHFSDTRVVLKSWKEKGILVCLSDRYLSKKKLQVNGTEASTYEIRIITSGEGHSIVQAQKPVIHSRRNLLLSTYPEEEEEDFMEVDEAREHTTSGGKIRNRKSRT